MITPCGDISALLHRLHEAAASIAPRRGDLPVAFMEVCGTHTTSAFRCGLHSVMPGNVRLISGPGCPVCVTAQSDIDQMIEVALRPNVTLCTYGDMLRVPGRHGSLELARSRGASVKMIYSTLDAVRFADRHREQRVVLAAVGFETTAPATAAAVLTAEKLGLSNFSVLTSHKRIMPAMTALLDAGEAKIDGFLCPGHVSVILGAKVYQPIVDSYARPCVVAGFEDVQILSGLALLLEQVRDGRAELVNDYLQAVSDTGNTAAQAMLDKVFKIADARWRGIGAIADSGYELRPEYDAFNARKLMGLVEEAEHEPHGCICGRVIAGAAQPNDCALFATACTPVRPIGPCMVSSEGTCQAWFKYHRASAPAASTPRGDA